MKIYLGSDHAGYDLKEKIKDFLIGEKNSVIDFGADNFNAEDDYPDFIRPVAEAVADDVDSKGIVFGGSGQGEAIVANRSRGVRCAVYYGGPKEIITLSRQHNDANILSIGARFVSVDDIVEIINLWLDTDFSQEERHKRRIDKIDV
jgi:ribose 5-phosphate isomerase B